jgi:O-methyltransferase involved in polyketide biosynthesis
MASKLSVRLGTVPETLLIPLYARAVENRRKHPILEDSRAIGIVDSIDWDFQRFGQRWRVVGCTLRSALFDELVKEFLRRHPDGTVVEIGSGLNTRFERLDNGRVHWFDLDLPDVIELRRKFFSDTARRTTLSASVLDADWVRIVRRSPGPYFMVAETVFVYLKEQEVKAALTQIAANFPGVNIAFDTVGCQGVEGANKDHERRKLDARFAWACDDPKEIEGWNIGLRLVDPDTIGEAFEALKGRLSLPLRTAIRVFRKLFPKVYQLNLFAGQSDS